MLFSKQNQTLDSRLDSKLNAKLDQQRFGSQVTRRNIETLRAERKRLMCHQTLVRSSLRQSIESFSKAEDSDRSGVGKSIEKKEELESIGSVQQMTVDVKPAQGSVRKFKRKASKFSLNKFYDSFYKI